MCIHSQACPLDNRRKLPRSQLSHTRSSHWSVHPVNCLNKSTLVVVGAAQKLVGSEDLAATAVVAHRVAHSVGVYDE
ncbi:hypothetical protein CCHR01_10257 [Colletotrichum chrysophilum]|uniref:Uncharacterized protein n=1 Tax=Colletotrichum chrysophilum TaxID=1836956 RepID=A0AAD9AHM8_9PEZI|nr:hypothetical protein CCHR01_10257 [Colletotrichum chrysophilum]